MQTGMKTKCFKWDPVSSLEVRTDRQTWEKQISLLIFQSGCPVEIHFTLWRQPRGCSHNLVKVKRKHTQSLWTSRVPFFTDWCLLKRSQTHNVNTAGCLCFPHFYSLLHIISLLPHTHPLSSGRRQALNTRGVAVENLPMSSVRRELGQEVERLCRTRTKTEDLGPLWEMMLRKDKATTFLTSTRIISDLTFFFFCHFV